MEEDPGIQVDGKGRTRLAQDSEGDHAHVSELDDELEGGEKGDAAHRLVRLGECSRRSGRTYANVRGQVREVVLQSARGGASAQGLERGNGRTDLISWKTFMGL